MDRCGKCDAELTDNNWYKCYQPPNTWRICKSCSLTRSKAWKIKHREEYYDYMKAYNRNYKDKFRKEINEEQMTEYWKVKTEVIAHYSNGTMSCYGWHEGNWDNGCPFNCSDMRCLSIDHIKGGGTQHSKTIKTNLYKWLKGNDYPNGFQVLCMNCQFIKRIENRETKRVFTE